MKRKLERSSSISSVIIILQLAEISFSFNSALNSGSPYTERGTEPLVSLAHRVCTSQLTQGNNFLNMSVYLCLRYFYSVKNEAKQL